MKADEIDIPKLRRFMARHNAVHSRVRNLTDRYIDVRAEYQRAKANYDDACKKQGAKRAEHLASHVSNLAEQMNQIQQQRDQASTQLQTLGFVEQCIEAARRAGLHVDPQNETAFLPAAGTPLKVEA